MDINPISGSAITKATEKIANQPMIGRTVTEYKFKKNRVIVYQDNINLRLWEIGAIALVGAIIWYAPDILNIFDVIPDIDLVGNLKKESPISLGEITRSATETIGQPISGGKAEPLHWPWEEDFKWPWEI